MRNKNNLVALAVIVGVIAVVAAVLYLVTPRSQYANGALDGFARCLASKGVVMYGAYWCPHCQNQKAEFGSSFKYANYVECTQEVSKCEANGIKGYPTWTWPGGTRLEGEQKLETLSSASQCLLPAQGSST
jgi:hypothetical protein